MHEFRAGSMLLQKAMSWCPASRRRSTTWDGRRRKWTASAPTTTPPLDNADAVLIYADGGKNHPAFQGDRPKILDALAAKGVGLGFAHYGVEVPQGAARRGDAALDRRLLRDGLSVNPMWKPEFEKFPNHPITRGVKPFATHDEWYFNMRWTPDAAERRS